MKHLRSALTVVVLALTSTAFAQHDAQPSSATTPPSAAQQSFTTIKTLAGEWEEPCHRSRDAGDVRWQADARIDARDLAWKRPGARVPGSRASLLGCDQI